MQTKFRYLIHDYIAGITRGTNEPATLKYYIDGSDNVVIDTETQTEWDGFSESWVPIAEALGEDDES